MTRLLHANGASGVWPPSLYAQRLPASEPAPALEGHVEAEVCIVGAGYTGIGAALALSEAGIDTVLLDAHRAGWGASGRNGGQLGSGWNMDPDTLVKRFGIAVARRLWAFSESAKAHVLELAERHAIPIDYHPGIITSAHRARHVKGLHRYADAAEEHFGYERLEPLDAAALAELCGVQDHHGGNIDSGAGHLDPLQLALGLRRVATDTGARLHEGSEVLRLERHEGRHVAVTRSGSVSAARLIVACNGYHDDLLGELGRHVLPVNNFIVATEPLGALAGQLLPGNHAFVDTRFVVGYARRSADDRLIYGGGENTGYRFPDDFASEVRRAMTKNFPQLLDARIEAAWGGTLAITPSRLPWVRELDHGTLCAGGYSGHGVALAVRTGRALADAHLGRRDELELLERLPARPFPGGARLRPALLKAAFTGASLLDRF